VDLLGSILSPEKKAKAAAAAPDTDDQGLPSRSARRVQKLRNQRKTRCNRSDWSSFSKQSLDQLLNGRKGSAYWPTIFQAHNAGDQLLVPAIPTSYCATEVHDNFEASSARAIACPRDDHKRNDLAPRSLSRLACVTRNRNTRHGTRIIALASRYSVADYSSGLVARGAARLILRARVQLR